jgi:IS5 family transposase
MRKAFSAQLRLDAPSVADVQLNFDCRDEIIPVLAALQHIYSTPALRDQILQRVAADVNSNTFHTRGREGLDYWQILVLASVRLGCNLNYDRLHNLAEDHRTLRAIMGIGAWDQTKFSWRRIRENVCLLKPETISSISALIVSAGHRLVPEAVETTRADSFVMETNIHYPTESTLIRDGVRKIIEACVALAEEHGLEGWRQHAHLQKQIKRTSRDIDRIATKKGPNYQQRLQREYRTLLQQSARIVNRARALCKQLGLRPATAADVFAPDSLRAYIARTERAQDTARRRVIDSEAVPNSEKLLSIYEPHTQLYKRGKAGEPVQFGRQVLIFEDAVGFITHYFLLPRDQGDKDVVVEQMRIVQKHLHGGIQRASFDRGFHSPNNQKQLAKIVPCVCLPKLGQKQAARQEATASVQFRQARQKHPGVESAIGALQSGNGLERCRDRSELGFERYLALGILGRNLHTLGRLLIADAAPGSKAAETRRSA